ncbi:MAG: hypothetical protein FJ271_15700 [Planctomycetes bacterium]|nr:hypothetical protein [Planctomycetota bacterium]
MQRLRNVVLGLAILLLAAAPVLAQPKGALDLVPADALGFGFVNNLDRVSDKIEAMFKRLQVPLDGSPLKKALGELGVNKGINEKGSIVAAVFPGERPVVVAIVPVSNFKDFADAVKAKDESLLVKQKGDYAIVTEGANKDALKKIVTGQGGIAGVVKPLEGWIAKVDLGAVVTSKGIEFLVAKAREGLGEFKNQPLPDEAKFIMGYVDGIEQFLKKCAIEVTHIAVGGKFADKGDLIVDVQALFAQEGPFAKFGAQAKAPAGGPLVGLPAGPFVIAAGGGGLADGVSMTKLVIDLVKVSAPDLPAEQAKKLETAMTDMYKGVSGASFMMGVAKAGEPIFSGTMMVMKVDDSAAYLKRFKRATLEVNEVYKDGKIPGAKPAEIKDVKVGQIPALETTTDMSETFEKIPGGLGGKIGEMIFGEGGKLRNSIVPADKTTVLIGYTSAAGIKSVLDAYRKKAFLGEDPEVLKTAAMLPKGSQFAGYFSPKGTMELVNRAVGGFLPIQLPAFPDTPPVGAALRLSASGMEARLVVPAAVQEGVGDLVQKIKQLIPGAN